MDMIFERSFTVAQIVPNDVSDTNQSLINVPLLLLLMSHRGPGLGCL